MGVGPSTTVEMEAENIVDEKKGEKDPATRREEPANKGGGGITRENRTKCPM